MKLRNLLFIFAALVFVAFTNSCNKDEIQPDEIVQPSISKKTQVAEKPSGLQNSSDQNAQTCASNFDMINGVMDLMSHFEVPKNADLVKTKSAGAWTWTWEEGGVTVWMTWTETESQYTWEYEVDYLNSGRTRYVYAEESKDGKIGKLELFGGYTEYATYVYNWTYDNSNNLVFEMNFDLIGFVYNITAHINTDGSGDYSYSCAGDVWYEVAWNVDGSGWWKYYDIFGGEFSGTWV